MDGYNSIFKHYGIPQEIIDEISLWTHKISFSDALDEIKDGEGWSKNNKLVVWPNRYDTRINEESKVFKKDYYNKYGFVAGVKAETLARGESNDVYRNTYGFKKQPANAAYKYMKIEDFWRIYEKTSEKELFCNIQCQILCSPNCPAIFHDLCCQGWTSNDSLY